jgi:PPE-repeat protein
MLTDTKAFNAQNRAAFAAMKDIDVVAGAGSLTLSQRTTVADAGNEAVGIPPLKEPFNQVVLVTDAGKQLRGLSEYLHLRI